MLGVRGYDSFIPYLPTKLRRSISEALPILPSYLPSEDLEVEIDQDSKDVCT